MAARAVVLEDPPGRLGDGAAEALAAVVEADARLVHDDRERLVRREREANPTLADEVGGFAEAVLPGGRSTASGS